MMREPITMTFHLNAHTAHFFFSENIFQVAENSMELLILLLIAISGGCNLCKKQPHCHCRVHKEWDIEEYVVLHFAYKSIRMYINAASFSLILKI